MAKKLTGTPKKRDMEVQGTQMTEAALKKRSQGIWIRRISAMMSALLACALFYVLMKPAITMENGNGSGNGAQLVCTVPEHVHTEQCWGYDHPETEPVYGLSRELECSFVPHVHDMDCYDEAGELICGISERYIHVHDDLCYDQGNLVCLLEESPWNPEEEAVQERVLVCDLPETAGHVHTDACYTVTYLTDEEPVCGLKEGGHVHTEDCYGPVLICEEEHEHTDDCYAEGIVCHLEEGTEHVHTLSCYPSIRELTCGLEETEGHVHDEDCYAFLTVEKEPHVHTEECYADDQLICGELEIRSHQHTEACWHETQVMLSGGHVHNSECAKVLLCGMQEHVHTRECYSGPETEIQMLLAENANTEKNGEAAGEADADMQEMLLEEEQLLTEEMDAAVDGVHLEDGEVIRTDETEPLQEEDGVLLSEEEELFSEWELVNEDPEWEDVQWEEESVQEMSDDGHETSASQEVSEEPTEPEHAVTDDAVETPASEEITEEPTETENSVADDAAGSRFEEAHYLQEVETLEDGTFAVHLHEDEGIYFRTILEKAGVEAEQVDVTSDIPFLDIREDSFVCRFAFTEGSVVIRAGGEELTVRCTYAGPMTDVENTAESGESGSSAETAADGLDNRVNAEVETGEDSAEGTDTERGEKEAAGNVHTEETSVDGHEDGTQTEGAAGEIPAGETDTERLDGDAAGEDSTEQTAADGQQDGTQAEDADGDDPAEGTGADQADSDAAGEERAEDNAADGQEHRTESEGGTEETSAGEIDAESEENEAAGENGTEDALTFVKELEKVEDGVYSVRLSVGSAVRLGDIPELEGIAPEEVIISSEIEDLETGTDSFACRKAFEQGNVILTSGEISVTVQCAYVPAAVEDEAGENDTAVDGTGDAENGETGSTETENSENAGENADAADETGNADASGEQGQDAAEPEIQDAARVLLNGEETDLLRLEENPEDAEAVLDMLRTYLALEASESQETGLEEDAAAAESDPANDDEEIRLTFTRVFGMEAEEAFEGTAGIYMPVHARFSDLLPEGSYLTSVNCQLFHIDLDHGEILPVQNFEVEISDEEIVSLSFETERAGTWVLLCTLDYAFEERAAVLTLDFSDFDALMLEDTEETGISVIEAEPEMNAEPAPGRRLLAKGRNNGQKKEENSSGFGGISIDLARLLEAVYAQNGAGEGEFQGIRMLMENLAGAEFSIETLVQEMSEGGVSCDGMSLQILDNGSILLRGKHMTLTIRIQGFAREKQEIYAYTFGEQKTVSMSEIFQASGMPEQFVPARFAYEVSDEELVTLIREGNDWQVTANRSFDEVVLYVRRGWYSGMILLHNPGKMVEPGTEIRSSDGAVSIVLNEEAVLPDGTELTVQPSEGMDIRLLLDQDFGENADVQVKWFDISLGDVHEIQAVVTLHGVIDVPEFAKKRGNVQARVYHAGSNGLEVLDAEVHGTDICFVTDGFSEFAVAYTVDFEYSVDGQVYQFSLPGGGFVSFTQLVEVLGIFGDTNTDENGDENGSAITENAEGNAANEVVEENDVNSDTYAPLTLGDVEVGEVTRKFVADVASVEFSSPSLVDVSKIENESTVGQIKENRGLECEYSAELTEEQIAEINAQTVKAGDWALISVSPFTSEETLKVTMKDGEVFTIQVTDAQIKKTVIDAKGDTWEITVTYDDSAVIPEGTELKVIEYSKNDLVYYRCHADREKWVADIIDNGENNSQDDGTITDIDNLTFEPGFGEAVNYDIDGDLSDEDKTQAASLIQFSGTPVISGYILFDISLIYNGTEIEPSAPVQVTIKSTNPDLKEYDDISVGHFVEKTTGISQELSMETIDEISYSSGDGKKNDQVIVGFETSSFSLYDVTGIQWTANESKTVYFALKAGINQILDVDQHGAISIGYSGIKNMSGEEVASYIQGLNDYQSAEPIVIYNKSGDSFYAIDGDGNLAQVYESGDTVMWSGQPSIGWKLIRYMNDDGEYTGYYDFINMETGKFLTPSSTSTVGVNRSSVQLDGAGLYSTTIKSWDNSVNTYVGYSINNGQLTTSASDEWYFAAVSQTVTDDLKLQTVETVDSRSLGITIKMFDYSNTCNTNNRSQEQTSYRIFNSDGLDWLSDGSVIQGLVQNKLNSEGYPVTTYANTNLKGLFSNGTDANKLFMLDTYQETGYFEYSSFQNFAHLNSNGDFTVYRQVGVEDTAKTPRNKTYGNATDTYYFNRGNFLPYNTIADYKTAVQKYGSSGVTNRYDENGNLLDGDDPRNGENLFLTQETVDYFFGMSMEADFYQPADGKNNGQDIIYEFNGDDDLWIFVDNVLVLDIGGCHHAHSGTINFTTGTVEVVTGRGTLVTTIRQCFKNAGVFPDGTAWDDSKANLYFSGDTFADYSQHNMKMFYMERGAGASNLHIKFNLPVIKDAGKLIVDKVVSGTVNQKYSNEKFAFQVIKVNGNTETRFTNAVYDSDGLPVEYKHEAEINGITYNDVFYLRPGEAAVFDVADNSQQYYVKELGIDSNYYDLVKINGVQTSIDSNGNVTSTVNTVRNRTRVTYDNHGITDNLRIKKQVEGDVKNQNALFEFYVYLTGPDDTLIPYSNGEYYVLDPNGYYCTYVDGLPVGDPTITEDTRTAYESGEWGTIGSLPEGYTIIIEDLLVGTDFMVSERDNRIPEGYEYKSNTVVEGTAGTAGLNAYTNVSVDQSGSMNIGSYSFSNHSEGQIISSNENDATVVVTNTLKYSIQAEKQWVNADNVTTHGTVQAALFKVDDGSGTYTVDSTKYTLVDGSVKEIKAGEVTTWKIVDAASNYIIREVMVDGTTVTPIDDNGMIAVSGETMKVSDGSQSAISDGKNIYIATYDQGVEANNTRKDTVTNTLPQIVLYKVDMTNLSKYLSDAVFTLSNANGTSVGEASYTSDSDGLIAELQLPVGTWYLTETNAPAGYNMLTDTVKLTVNENGTVTAMLDGSVGSIYTDQTNTDITKFTFNIPNNPGVELPSTGGPGTRLFMILGSMLSLGAGLLLWRRRRTI